MPDPRIQRALGSIEAKIDRLLEGERDHEARLRNLEEHRARRAGALMVLAAIVSWFSSLALRKI